MLGCSVAIHDWHVDVHQDESVLLAARALLVPVRHELFDRHGSVESLVWLELELGLEEHLKRHQVEWVVVDTEDCSFALASYFSACVLVDRLLLDDGDVVDSLLGFRSDLVNNDFRSLLLGR